MKRMNKKGDEFTGELLGVMLAVIGIILMSLFIWYFVRMFVGQQEDRSAQKISDIIDAKIKELKDGESGKVSFKGPCNQEKCNWYLGAYSSGSEGIPSSCTGLSCLCVCNGETGTACVNKVYCKSYEVAEVKIINAGINNVETGGTLITDAPSGESTIQRVSQTQLRGNLQEIEIKKESNKIGITFVK